MYKILMLLSLIYSLSLMNGSCEANDVVKQSWSYVDVRQDAKMFWWLYYANSTNNAKLNSYSSYPLVIWLQGGPGGSSTGFGNFEEIGPDDINLKSRNTSWIKYANLLFIDNPVGTGYSYVTDSNAYATNNSQIAIDLVNLLKDFFRKLPEFQSIPLYIFSESYGGKMTTTIAIQLWQTIKSGDIQCNFQGIALGDSWISPIDSVATWAQYLYTLSLIDAQEKKQIEVYVEKIRNALKQEQYSKATDLWSQTEGLIEELTDGVNFYNILQSSTDNSFYSQIGKYYSDLGERTELNPQMMRLVGSFHKNSLFDLMNGPIKKALNIPSNVTWGGQSSQVFLQLKGDFMIPVVDEIDFLLNNTDLKIVVYSGQLDLIVDSIGTQNWINSLKWSGLENYQNAEKTSITSQIGNAVGFMKTYKNFTFFWILKAGHMIPSDAGDTALLMLQKIIQTK